MKKICFLSGCLDNPGGTERVGISIANELTKSYDIHIISLSKREKPYFEINKKVKVHYLNLTINKINYFKIIFLINHYLKKNNIEMVIEIDLILRIYTLPIQLVQKRLKIISWEHFYYGENLGVKLRDYCRKIAAKKSDLIVTLTQKDLEMYSKNEFIKNRILNIPNPLPKESIEKSDLISKRIICVGRLSYQKGFDLIIKDSFEFFKKFSDWEIHIYGEGDEELKLQELIKKNKLDKNIIINKPTRDIYKEYLKSTIFLLPSRFEPFGMVLIEAMSCGLVPISFKSIGPNEIIENGKDGILIENSNVNEMFLQIENLINNKILLKNLSINAAKKVKKYSLEEIGRKWKGVLDEL